ncbi:MAG: Ti-type conjugative transfer relaxase TraA [Desulfatitalea sp.]|nr:Ti-type conjugative transfer relaxase TraA [Desulfatitalea sp.]NNK00499.1 Ti-type conjugative transfer relaxase TraA [Desulfatitalea sp.]
MADYRLHANVITRSKGASGVAAAAYRSCAIIRDDRQGITFDYSKKKGLAHSEILAPSNAQPWMLDREKLWNHIEKIETRKNSQISREIQLSLPVELTLEQNIECAREFIINTYVKNGMIADFNIHMNDANNPHAHVMLTMRKIEGDGFGGKKAARIWNERKLLKQWRERWAEHQNIHLAKAGLDIRVDHRSYKDQGIDLIPQIKVGAATYGEKPLNLERAEKYKEILEINGQKIIEDPDIVLDALSKKQSTFTYDDILKYVHAHSDEQQFYDALSAVLNSKSMVKVEEKEHGRFDRYTYSGLIEIERQMYVDTTQLDNQQNHIVDDRYIDRALASKSLSKEQADVVTQTCKGKDIHAIVGYAGAGKSYTLDAIRHAYESKGYRVKGASLAAVAAEGLQDSSGIESVTVAKLLNDWQNGYSTMDKDSVLVIDEAGMLGTRQMQVIVQKIQEAGAKLIVVGDTKQTQAIEAGAAFRGLLKYTSASILSEIWRQKEAWQQRATRLLAGDERNISKAFDLYMEAGHIHEHSTFSSLADDMVQNFVKNYTDKETSVMIAHKNETVDYLNRLARFNLKEKTSYVDDRSVDIQTSSGIKQFSSGDRIIFLKTDSRLGFKNGQIGTISKAKRNGILIVDMPGNESVVVDTQRYAHVDYGYAATVHKTQGATYDCVSVAASDGYDRHLAYVAASRHRKTLNVHYSTDQFENYEKLKWKLSRNAEKELLLDYENIEPLDRDALTRKTKMNATFNEKTKKELISDLGDGVLDRIKYVGTDYEGKDRFTSDDYKSVEEKLFKKANQLCGSKVHVVDKETINQVLEDKPVSNEYRHVVTNAINGTDLTVIEHQYGADYGYAARLIAETYRRKGYIVEGISIAGIGAENFMEDSGIDSDTIAKKLFMWSKGIERLSDKHVIFIEHANNIGTEQMDEILTYAQAGGAKVLMFGEHQALQSIGSGGAYRGIIEYGKGTQLKLRQQGKLKPWQQKAYELMQGDEDQIEQAFALFSQNGCIHRTFDPDATRNGLVHDWFMAVKQTNSYRENLMLTVSNKTSFELNESARKKLKAAGYVDKEDHIIDTELGSLKFSAGDRIMFLRKENDIQVKSGTLGTIRSIDGSRLVVALDGGPVVTVESRIYDSITYGYATNIYRGANIRAKNTYVLVDKSFDRQIAMAALGAHKKQIKIYHSFKNHQQFVDSVTRSREKDLVADYPMHKQVYKLSVKFQAYQWKSTHLVVEQKMSEEALRRHLSKETEKFIVKEAGRMRIAIDPATTVAKVEKLDRDQALGFLHEKNNDRNARIDRGV